MKIAIISDVHANLEALKTTLEDIKRRKVDKIICLGDTIAKGAHPSQCIKLIRDNCDIVLQGNTDEYFSLEHENLVNYPNQEKERILFNHSMLRDEERKYLLSLPFSYEFYISGRLVRLFHATPTKNNRAVLNVDSFTTKYEMFLPSEKTLSNEVADMVLYGHIHHPYMDKIYNKTLINVGSVGNSFDTVRNEKRDSSSMETSCSNYVILEGDYGQKEKKTDISFSFVRVNYDIDKELITGDLNIEKDAYEFEIRNGMYRNMDKINENFRKLGIEEI